MVVIEHCYDDIYNDCSVDFSATLEQLWYVEFSKRIPVLDACGLLGISRPSVVSPGLLDGPPDEAVTTMLLVWFVVVGTTLVTVCETVVIAMGVLLVWVVVGGDAVYEKVVGGTTIIWKRTDT